MLIFPRMEVHPSPVSYPAPEAAAPASPYAPPVTDPVVPAGRPATLVEAVQAGHRFYLVPYVISAVVITFRRNMGQVHEVSDGKWPVLPIAGATLLTSLLGWWGFPWGVAFSFATLIRLWNGGKDVTKDLLQQAVGTEEAKRILAAAPKPVKPPSFLLLRLLVLAGLSPAIWIISLIVMAIFKV